MINEKDQLIEKISFNCLFTYSCSSLSPRCSSVQLRRLHPVCKRAEEVSENEAILAYLNGLCKSKYEDDEEDEDYKRLLFSEKALSAYQSREEDYNLTESLRGFTANGNTNGERFMKAKQYSSNWSYYYAFLELIDEEIIYIITEDEYKAFLETQPQAPLKDIYEVSTAKEFEKAVNAVNSADDGETRTIKLTADKEEKYEESKKARGAIQCRRSSIFNYGDNCRSSRKRQRKNSWTDAV